MIQKATFNTKTLYYEMKHHHWLKEDWLDVFNPQETFLRERVGREITQLFTNERHHGYYVIESKCKGCLDEE